MDDSFRVRVDKIFGGLGPNPSNPSSSTPSSSLRSLWSLSDEEIEKREWNRPQRDSPDREDAPCSSTFNRFLANNKKKSKKNEFDDLDDEDDDEEGPSEAANGEEGEDWEIRSSIGLDPTLDHEEEEDEFDKVAVGRENAGERVYMKAITDYGPYLNAHNVLPTSFKEHAIDPRADLKSAMNRLKEDEGAGSFDSNRAADAMQAVVKNLEVNANKKAGNLKPILKRKEKSQTDSKSNKRVRFDPACKDNSEQEFDVPNSMTPSSTDTATAIEDTSSGVPDYVKNPSKYTCYTFDTSSDVTEQSNRGACMDFLNTLRKSKNPEAQPEGISELPKSITFTPKKKATDAAALVKRDNTEMDQDQDKDNSSKEAIRRASVPLSIADEETIENEACAMEEDEQPTTTSNTSGSSRKPGRQYRAKISYEDSVA